MYPLFFYSGCLLACARGCLLSHFEGGFSTLKFLVSLLYVISFVTTLLLLLLLLDCCIVQCIVVVVGVGLIQVPFWFWFSQVKWSFCTPSFSAAPLWYPNSILLFSVFLILNQMEENLGVNVSDLIN